MGTAFKEFFNVQRDTVTNFSVEDYLSVQNTLIVYSEMVSPLMSKFIHKTITSANTLLAADGIIPHNGNGQAFFYTCDDNAVKQLNTELAAYRLEKLSVDYRELKGKTTKMRL